MTILPGPFFFLVSLPYTSNAMFSVIKTSDYVKLEINGHPGAGYSFLNFSFMVNVSLQTLLK